MIGLTLFVMGVFEVYRWLNKEGNNAYTSTLVTITEIRLIVFTVVEDAFQNNL